MELCKIYNPKNQTTWTIYKTTNEEETYVVTMDVKKNRQMYVKYSLESAIYTIIDNLKK